MQINDWPIYVNDYGHIECNMPGCNDEWLTDVVGIGRRTNFGSLKRVLINHARECHKIELTES